MLVRGWEERWDLDLDTETTIWRSTWKVVGGVTSSRLEHGLFLLYYSQYLRVKMVNGGVRLEEDGVMDDEGESGMNVFLFQLYDGDMCMEMELSFFVSAEIAVLLLDTSVAQMQGLLSCRWGMRLVSVGPSVDVLALKSFGRRSTIQHIAPLFCIHAQAKYSRSESSWCWIGGVS